MSILPHVLLVIVAQNATPQAESAEVVRTFSGHRADVYDVALSPGVQTLATAAFDGSVRLWNVATGDVVATLTGHEGKVLSVAFNDDGRFLLSGGEDKTVRLWSVPVEGAREIAANVSRIETFAISRDHNHGG